VPTENDYIDIHTHRDRTNNFLIRNLFPENMGNMRKDRFYSIGWHPWYLEPKLIEVQMSRVNSAANNACILAIGETGLDKLADAPMDLQINIFKRHSRIAEETGKPLIIHAVKAFEEIIRVKNEMHPNVPWILHGFNKKPEVAEMLINQGFMLSFGKALLDTVDPAFEVIKKIPADRFFLETDDSDADIVSIYEAAAKARDEDVVNLKRNLYNNFKTHFL